MKKYLWYLLTLLIVLMMLTGCGKNETQTEKEIISEEQQEQSLSFPYELENGKLVINSLFQSSIMNPDCRDEMGEDVATLELENGSGEFLESAEIVVTLTDGEELEFEISCIPDGEKVWVFEKSNKSIAKDAKCELIICKGNFANASLMMEDKVSVVEDGTMVTLNNLTEETLSNLTIDFHCLFDGEVYYGGRIYTYPVERIEPGSSISFDVEECYLGEAKAVRITGND